MKTPIQTKNSGYRFTLAAFALLPLSLLSQIFSAPNMSGPAYPRTDMGTMVPASLMYTDGRTEQVTMKRQAPEQLKYLDNVLDANDRKVPENTLTAFSVDGNTWAQRLIPSRKSNKLLLKMFVVLTRQGGIQQYYWVTGEYSKNILGPPSQELITWKNGDSLPGTNYSAMIADCPQLSGKLNAQNSNLDSVLTAYNLWYEKQNPGKIAYIFQGSPTPFAVTPKDFKAQMQRNRERKDSIQNAMKDRMAARPASPDPAIVSKTPNLPPKKETFSAKVKRFETEGHKIGVMIASQKITISNTGGGCVEGPKEKPFEDTEYAKMVTKKLNELYQTTIFELVSIDQVPMKMVKTYTVDDWWTTCYKVVVSLSQTRLYSANLNKIDLENDVQYFIDNKAVVVEYIDDGKNSSDYLKRNYNMGDGYSNTLKYKECGTLEKFQQMVDPKETQERFEKSQAERFAKLVEKWD